MSLESWRKHWRTNKPYEPFHLLQKNSNMRHAQIAEAHFNENKLTAGMRIWPVIIIKRGDLTFLHAVPVPPGNYHMGHGNNGSSSSENAMHGRLRAASEGQRQGFITSEEKTVLKKLLLSKDSKLRGEDFDRAFASGDWDHIRSRLRTQNIPPAYEDEASGMIHHMSEVRLEGSAVVEFGGKPGGTEEFPNLFDPFYDQADLKEGLSAIVPSEETEYETPAGSFLINDDDGLVENMTPSSRKRQASRDKMRDFGNSLFPGFQPGKVSKRRKPEMNGAPGLASVGPNMANGGGNSPVVLNGSNNVNKSRLSGLNPRQEGSFLKHLKKLNPASAAMDLISNNKESLSKTKKNERERKRRLAVSKGFEDLATMLKPFNEEYGRPQSSKIDKATILRNTIETLKELKARVNVLEKQNKELWDQIYNRR